MPKSSSARQSLERHMNSGRRGETVVHLDFARKSRITEATELSKSGLDPTPEQLVVVMNMLRPILWNPEMTEEIALPSGSVRTDSEEFSSGEMDFDDWSESQGKRFNEPMLKGMIEVIKTATRWEQVEGMLKAIEWHTSSSSGAYVYDRDATLDRVRFKISRFASGKDQEHVAPANQLVLPPVTPSPTLLVRAGNALARFWAWFKR